MVMVAHTLMAAVVVVAQVHLVLIRQVMLVVQEVLAQLQA